MSPAADLHREYATGAIAVIWEPALCIHTRNCVRGLPQVFDPERRPWITVDAATADELAGVIETCPTGALRYRRLDGEPEEQAADPSVVTPAVDGPLFVRGRMRVVDDAGDELYVGPRVALCRCGASANKPFCDGTHRRIGFRSA